MSSERVYFFSEDVNVSCSECGKQATFSVDFDEVAGDLRLNFVKVRTSIPPSETCPHCGNEVEVDVSYWRREFYCKNKDGKEVCRYFFLWPSDNSAGCSVDGLLSLYETFAIDHPEDLALDSSSALELVDLLYKTTRDEALLPVKESLKNGGDVESLIPELKRIIDSHDDVLKDAYLSQFPD
jgi:endogenous inhibitor of DNA gyrase (YacG/DUF329 family)